MTEDDRPMPMDRPGCGDGDSAASRAQLVRRYQAGMGTLALADRFGVHRDTVHSVLKRAGVLRPQAELTELQLREVVELRRHGWSYQEIAERFDVDPETVRRHVLRTLN